MEQIGGRMAVVQVQVTANFSLELDPDEDAASAERLIWDAVSNSLDELAPTDVVLDVIVKNEE